MTLVIVLPVGAGGEGQRHAVLEHRLGEGRRRRRARAHRRPSIRRAGAGRQHQRLARARAGAPGDRVGARRRPRSASGRAERTRSRIASTTVSPTGMRRTRRWVAMSASASRRPAACASVGAGGLDQHAPLGLAVGIADVDLRAGSGRAGPRAAGRCPPAPAGSGSRARGTGCGRSWRSPADRDVVLLHRLQQRRLGARAGAVDLVGHQELGEDRALARSGSGRRPSAPSSSTSEPRMSEGIRSGVNWTRRASRPSTVPSVSTSFVLARPGTPTRRPWPPAREGDERQVDDRLPGRR